MFVDDTVLVLGAGASAPYGFPVGTRLIECILKTGYDWKGFERIKQRGFDRQEWADFQRELRLADRNSIDLFLEHRPEFRDLGRYVIAGQIAKYEDEENIQDQGDGRWYRTLLDHIGDSPEDFANTRLKVITFNYDRSLEHALHSRLRGRHGLKTEQAAELVQHIEVLHVYGSLGKLPWQKRTQEDFTMPYGFGRDERCDLRNVAANLKIICEAKECQEIADKATAWIKDAAHVFVAGFGFHKENMELIGLQNGKKVVCTRRGVNDQKLKRVQSWCPNLQFFGGIDEGVDGMMDRCPQYLDVAEGFIKPKPRMTLQQMRDLAAKNGH